MNPSLNLVFSLASDMMTYFSENMNSFPAEGDVVGVSTRRKIIGESRTSNRDSELSREEQTCPSKELHSENQDIRSKYERHIYHDIRDVRDEIMCEKKIKKQFLPGEKPEIPPKPFRYVLRDKRSRHVYQTIDLTPSQPTEAEKESPPPLPIKPKHLVKLADIPPPLPPRVVNSHALQQRHKLNKEYLEHLRKSLDDNLLELVDEGDLPAEILNSEISGSNCIFNEQSVNSVAHDRAIACLENSENSLHIQNGLSTESSLAKDYNSIDSCIGNITNPLLSEHHTALLRNSAALRNTLPTERSQQALLVRNLALLKRCGWYWGNMTWQEAESLLLQKEEEGVFLMRDSQNPLHLLTVTVRSAINTIHHIRVEYLNGKFQLYEPGRSVSRSAAQCVRHANVAQFIQLAMRHSLSGSFLYFVKPKNMGEPPIQIRLMTPVSRFSKVKSLQYVCRLTIRQHILGNSIDALSVPQKLKDYLMAATYYDPSEN